MDGGINVDDLFGEQSLELGLPPAPFTKCLSQRLDEMRLLGCCQYVMPCYTYGKPDVTRKVSWSKLGCIAYISQDGLRVNIRHLQCQPADGKWALSDETPLHPVTEAHGSNPLVHLCWNESGSELAVVDASGRISIYSLSIALNSIAGHRPASLDSADDGNQVVGMMWLNTQRSVSVYANAVHNHLPDSCRCMPSPKLPRCKAAGPIRRFAVAQSALFIPQTKRPLSL